MRSSPAQDSPFLIGEEVRQKQPEPQGAERLHLSLMNFGAIRLIAVRGRVGPDCTA